ncbi:hypothetical protein JXB27_02905 [Candidatus Woesearchaeota archaeon]|nr:hypothetical protein [Candidatus Woesearchaeota archaeon]
MTYQGILFAREQTSCSCEEVYFAPSQLEEYKKYIQEGKLPDGRIIIKSKLFDNPVDRETLENESVQIGLEALVDSLPGLGIIEFMRKTAKEARETATEITNKYKQND